MSGRKKSPKCSQPTKKKRRMKSKGDSPGDVNKGPSASATGGVKDISTNSGTNTILIQENTGTSIKMQAQQPQQMQFPPPQAQQLSYQSNVQTPPPTQVQSQVHMPMQLPYSPSQQSSQMSNTNYSFQYRPDWATEILDNMKEMKNELSKLSGIEKSLVNLTIKFSKLENKVGAMETVVNNCEQSCTFLSSVYDTQSAELKDTKNNLKEAKESIQSLRQKCVNLEQKMDDEAKNKIKLESKVTDLEARSMRENLLFHGIPESHNENCELLIKQFMAAELKIEHEIVDAMVLDRVHRIGRYAKGPNFVRPIVAKFHKYTDRERVRELGYNMRDELQAKKLAIKPQLPNCVMQKRKELGPVYEKAKKDGKNPRFIMDRLFIDGVEYTVPS